MSYYFPSDGNCPCQICRSRRTGGAGNPAIQGCRYGASLSACLYHFRTAVRGEAGTESNGLFGLWQGGPERISGVVTWISDSSEFTPKTILTKDERANLVYAVKVAVKNDGMLKIGMYGGVEFK